MDDKTGIFPGQANGPMKRDEEGNFQITPLAVGKKIDHCANKHRKRAEDCKLYQ